MGTTFKCGARASYCSGFPCGGAQALVSGASVVGAHELSCPEACGISGPGIEPMSLSLAGRFLTTGPLGKSKKTTF